MFPHQQNADDPLLPQAPQSNHTLSLPKGESFCFQARNTKAMLELKSEKSQASKGTVNVTTFECIWKNWKTGQNSM